MTSQAPRLYPRGTRPEDIPAMAVGVPWAEYQRLQTREDLIDMDRVRELAQQQIQRAKDESPRARGNNRLPGENTRRLIPAVPEQTPDVGSGFHSVPQTLFPAGYGERK